MTGHASFASTQRGGERPPATKATGLCTPSPKKKNTGRVLPGSLLVLPVRGLPAVRALALGRFDGAGPGPACCACAGAAGGCRWCRCSLCVVLRRPRQPRWRGPGVGLPLFLCVARSCLKRSWGRRAQPGGGWPAHRVATGAPAGLLGRGTGIARVVAVAALLARVASTQEGPRPRQHKQRSSATLSKKRKHRRSLRKHVAAVAVRLPVLPLL